jgi:hypothetical protein
VIVTTPVEKIIGLLEKAGYQRVRTPLEIASIRFDLAAAFVGTAHNPDLIVVFDTAFEPDDQIQRKVEGIGRALDVMGSRRPLTVVLAGPRPGASILDALSRVSRVLPVGTVIHTDPDASLQKWLAVLLPLDLPSPSGKLADPVSELTEHMPNVDSDAVATLITASVRGTSAVETELQRLIREPLQGVEGIS